MSVCKFQNMNKCAMQYCDFWNQEQKSCALALEVHERVELLERVNKILKKIEKTGRDDVAIKMIEHLTGTGMQLH